MFNYGTPFTFTFFAEVDGAPVSLPAQTATLYLYRDYPSREDAIAGTGASYGPYTEAVSAGATTIPFDVPAIPDPDANSAEPYRYWYAAVVYKLETAGPDYLTIRGITLQRLTAHHTSLTVSLSELKGIWEPVSTYASLAEIEAYTRAVLREIRADLESRGYVWDKVYNPADLKDVALYSVLVKVLESETQGAGDRFDSLATKYRGIVDKLMGSLRLQYGDPIPVTSDPEPVGMGIMLVGR